MADLVLYLGVTAIGYVTGSKVRSIKSKFTWTGKVQTVAITLLVLLMGMRMGSNSEITENLKTIGVVALVMTIFTVVGSIIAIMLTRKIMGIDRHGYLKASSQNIKSSTLRESKESEKADVQEGQGINMMTIFILVAVIIGMLVGYFWIRSAFEGRLDAFDSFAGLMIKIGLCILLVFVGLDLGMDGTVVENFKKVGLRILAFPLAVIIGTLVGAAISGLFFDLSIKESLAIGAGFGWYTLAPGIIMEAGYITASAVSFLHNVMRELSAILLIPLVAAKVGYIETTGMPGAAAMDVCLPIVEKSTRGEIAVYSFVSGVILSIVVPILVPIFIG